MEGEWESTRGGGVQGARINGRGEVCRSAGVTCGGGRRGGAWGQEVCTHRDDVVGADFVERHAEPCDREDKRTSGHPQSAERAVVSFEGKGRREGENGRGEAAQRCSMHTTVGGGRWAVPPFGCAGCCPRRAGESHAWKSWEERGRSMQVRAGRTQGKQGFGKSHGGREGEWERGRRAAARGGPDGCAVCGV